MGFLAPSTAYAQSVFPHIVVVWAGDKWRQLGHARRSINELNADPFSQFTRDQTRTAIEQSGTLERNGSLLSEGGAKRRTV